MHQETMMKAAAAERANEEAKRKSDDAKNEAPRCVTNPKPTPKPGP